MSDVFISYSRKDTQFVRKLYNALVAHQRKVWVDWHDIPPAADFPQEILTNIQAAQSFVFVLSPDSITSRWCARELEHAVDHKKRLIPIICQDIARDASPDPLRNLNWIPLRERDDFAGGIQSLLKAMDTDLDHVHAHTRYEKRAIEWNDQKRNDSFVLRGSDLRAAEEWLAQAATGKEPKPTTLQTEYILASRKSETRRYRTTLGAVTVVLIVAIVLAVFAVEQRNVALARQLATQAQQFVDGQPALLSRAALLAVESLLRYPTLEGNQALSKALALMPHEVGNISQDKVGGVALSLDGRWAATSTSGRTTVWDLATRREHAQTGYELSLQRIISFSRDGKWVVSSADWDEIIHIWEAATATEINRIRLGSSLTMLD